MEVDTFLATFNNAAWRRPILVIVGGTGTGKSVLGGTIIREVGAQLGFKEASFLEVTMESDENLELNDFDLHKHAGVLLDGAGDVLFLQKQREALQGRPKVCKGGKSSTMMYFYSYILCRRAVVATLDLAARNLGLLRTQHWLSDPRNVLTLWLDAPAYQQHPGTVALALPLSNEDRMKAWSLG